MINKDLILKNNTIEKEAFLKYWKHSAIVLDEDLEISKNVMVIKLNDRNRKVIKNYYGKNEDSKMFDCELIGILIDK